MESPIQKVHPNIDSAQSQRLFAFFAAALSWSAIIIQAYLFYSNRTTSTVEMIIRYFSFFTILSNILVATAYTTRFMKSGYPLVIFFQKASTIYAITVYILIVGMVYNIVLRDIWHPTGMQKWIDEILHAVVPLLFFIYWILFVALIPISWKTSFKWLSFPAIYFVLILTRGYFASYYPYPFLNVINIGLQKALLNGLVLVLCFWSLSICLIAFGKLIQRFNRRKNL